MNESTNEETLLEFPCDYGIKAMGETSSEFESIVLEVIRRHGPEIVENGIYSKQSSGGKYTSVTVTIIATSKQQLDAIYQDLTKHKLVKYAL